MNAVGIDVSKGKSMVAIMRPLGEVVAPPFEVGHTINELKRLATYLKSLEGETKVIMEYTGKYYLPIARHLHGEGIQVSVIHPMLVHRYGGNTLRKIKTDKKDAVRIANYGLDRWLELPIYHTEEDTRQLLKSYNRQYGQYTKLKVMLKNNLISLLDQAFPGANSLFSACVRSDGHEKWIDFVAEFWHCTCVSTLTEVEFADQYRQWCRKCGYHQSGPKATAIYNHACSCVSTLMQDDFVRALIKRAVKELNSIMETLAWIHQQMQSLACILPEYPVVMAMGGVGQTLGPQLMAEIGDVRRFQRKQQLVAFSGIDAPPYQRACLSLEAGISPNTALPRYEEHYSS